jgi:hypothetical protein
MNPNENQITVRPRASHQLAALIGMEPGAMLDAIKVQCFKCDPSKVSNEQLAAFVSIAAEMGVNPFLPDMIYAYPTANGGILPIMGPSGVYKKLTEHPDVDSWETTVFPEDVTLPPTHAVTKIWRKGRDRPLSYTALMSEWRINANPNWNTRPRHMLGLRSLKHCARQIIHGLPYDIDDREIINITTSTEQASKPSLSALIGGPVEKPLMEVVAPSPAQEPAAPEKPADPTPPTPAAPVAETPEKKTAAK